MSAVAKAFVDDVFRGDFQFQGTISGQQTNRMTGAAMTDAASTTISGTIKAKGNDVALSMTRRSGTETSTLDAIAVGKTVYTRTNGSPWDSYERDPTGANSLLAPLCMPDVVDKGLGTFRGRRLHKLMPTTYPTVSPFSLGRNSGITTQSLQITFWAANDGTPAGMTVQQSYRMDTGASTLTVESTVDYTFDRLSGVTITAPV